MGTHVVRDDAVRIAPSGRRAPPAAIALPRPDPGGLLAIIDRAFTAGDRVGVVAPVPVAHADALSHCRASPVPVPLLRNPLFAFDFWTLRRLLTEGVRGLLVANPALPTGTWLEPRFWAALADDFPRCVLIVDESHGALAPDSAAGLANERPNLIVIPALASLAAADCQRMAEIRQQLVCGLRALGLRVVAGHADSVLAVPGVPLAATLAAVLASAGADAELVAADHPDLRGAIRIRAGSADEAETALVAIADALPRRGAEGRW